jgi:hypothetical protein
MAGSASLAAAAIPGSTASATVKTLTCTKLAGSETSQTVSGCSGTGSSQTGTTGTQKPNIAKKTATITWTSTHKTTTYKYTYTLKSGAANTCPNLSGKKKVDLVIETGTVTGGTATGLVSGKFSGDTCAYEETAAPHSVSVTNKGPTKY